MNDEGSDEMEQERNKKRKRGCSGCKSDTTIDKAYETNFLFSSSINFVGPPCMQSELSAVKVL
jgi:hypothetical protein